MSLKLIGAPGYYRLGAPISFLGLCDECDARYLAQVDSWGPNGERGKAEIRKAAEEMKGQNR